jgi:hypothetical protein
VQKLGKRTEGNLKVRLIKKEGNLKRNKVWRKKKRSERKDGIGVTDVTHPFPFCLMNQQYCMTDEGTVIQFKRRNFSGTFFSYEYFSSQRNILRISTEMPAEENVALPSKVFAVAVRS